MDILRWIAISFQAVLGFSILWIILKDKDLETDNKKFFIFLTYLILIIITLIVLAKGWQMSLKEVDHVFKLVRDEYGLEFELGILQEECAELIVAVSKFKRDGNSNTLDELFSEIADVELMTEQLKRWFENYREYVELVKEEKLTRLEIRVKEDRRKNGSTS